jgi:hypothetical protein
MMPESQNRQQLLGSGLVNTFPWQQLHATVEELLDVLFSVWFMLRVILNIYWKEVRWLVLPRTSCLIILQHKAVPRLECRHRTVEMKRMSYSCLNEWLVGMWFFTPLIRSQVLLPWIASNIVSSLQHLAFLFVWTYFLLTVFHAVLPEETGS